MTDEPEHCLGCDHEMARGYGNYAWLCDYCADEAAYEEYIDQLVDERLEAKYASDDDR